MTDENEKIYWPGKTIFKREIQTHVPIVPQLPGPQFEVSYEIPAPDTPDGDYTQECLDAGTTFSLDGAVTSDPIPVTYAVVKGGVLTIKGFARFGDPVIRSQHQPTEGD